MILSRMIKRFREEMVKEANYYYLEVKDSSGNMTIEDLNTKVIDNKPELKLNGKK